MAEQEFTGVRLFLNIPAEVAHDPRLKDKSILLFGEIFSMLNVTGSFFMSNKEMAKRIRAKSERTVQKCLDELEKYGYIRRDLIRDKKTGQVKSRGKITSPYLSSLLGGEKIFTGGVNENAPGGESDCAIKEQYNKSSNNNVQKQLEEEIIILVHSFGRRTHNDRRGMAVGHSEQRAEISHLQPYRESRGEGELEGG